MRRRVARPTTISAPRRRWSAARMCRVHGHPVRAESRGSAPGRPVAPVAWVSVLYGSPLSGDLPALTGPLTDHNTNRATAPNDARRTFTHAPERAPTHRWHARTLSRSGRSTQRRDHHALHGEPLPNAIAERRTRRQ